MTVAAILSSVLVVAGAGLVALSGLGLLTLPDPLTRATGVSKAASLGVVLVLVAVLVADPAPRTIVLIGLVLAAHLVTSPLSGLALGRAAYRSGTARPPVTRIDEPAAHGRRDPEDAGADPPDPTAPPPRRP